MPLVGANDGVEALLDMVSDPTHADYGKYLTPAELADRFAAPRDVQDRVEAFFAQYDGVSCGSVGGASLSCTASAAAVERVFHTSMHEFTHVASGRIIVRHTGTVSLPQAVADDIVFVSGLSQFFHFPAADERVHYYHHHHHHQKEGVFTTANASTSTACGGSHGQNCFVTPSTLRGLYNVSSADTTGSAKTSVGVAEFSGNFAIDDASLATFGSQIGSKVDLAINRRGGQPNQPTQQVSEEAQLDIEYTSAMANGVTNWVVSYCVPGLALSLVKSSRSCCICMWGCMSVDLSMLISPRPHSV